MARTEASTTDAPPRTVKYSRGWNPPGPRGGGDPHRRPHLLAIADHAALPKTAPVHTAAPLPPHSSTFTVLTRSQRCSQHRPLAPTVTRTRSPAARRRRGLSQPAQPPAGVCTGRRWPRGCGGALGRRGGRAAGPGAGPAGPSSRRRMHVRADTSAPPGCSPHATVDLIHWRGANR